MVSPLCLATSWLVRARRNTKLASWASVVNIFCPLMTHSSPSRSALVLMEATSDPESGSL